MKQNESSTKELIPIFFTIDDGYAPYLSVALKSAAENASSKYDYKAIVIYQELSEENQKKLGALATENFTIDFRPIRESLDCITDQMGNRLRCDYFTLTIYFRLFIPQMFPEYDKGIYIDSDIVVPGDLAELYHIELGDKLLGAAADHSVVGIPEIVKYMEQSIGINRYEYINSGVLLMNLKKMREVKLGEHFLRLLNQYHFDCIAPDQDYLNAMCNGSIVYLDECWDAMPAENANCEDAAETVAEPKLIHYNLFSKPWCYDQVQYEDYFWKYAEHSGYLNEIKAFKEHYSEADKQSDQECLQLLIQRAFEIPDKAEITFKKAYESGEKIRL